MALDEAKVLGVVNGVGLARDTKEFKKYNLTVGLTLKTDKITYRQGEKLVKELKKTFLGKNIKLEAVAIPCPICGKTFNSENGTKQHVRLMHKKGGKPKKRKSKKK